YTRSEAPSLCNTSTKRSVRVYRSSTAAGAAGEALGVLGSPRLTDSTATTAGMWLLRQRRSIVVENRAHAALPFEHRIAAVAEEVQVERLVDLPLAVAPDVDRDRLGRLAGCEGQCAGPGDVVAARRGPVDGLKRHRHRLVVGSSERDHERELGRLILIS